MKAFVARWLVSVLGATAIASTLFHPPAAAAVHVATAGTAAHPSSAQHGKYVAAKSTSYRYVKVRAGDTLWGIAARYHVSVQQLMAVNHLGANSVLHIGQTLVIPGSGNSGTTLSNRSGASVAGLAPDALGLQVASFARQFVGVPYRWAGTTPVGFDCSGFVSYVYRHFGIALPRTSYDMYSVGDGVSQSELLPGMLVFFDTYGSGASHVGIYLGNGQFISAEGNGVHIASMYDSYWSRHYVGARSVFH